MDVDNPKPKRHWKFWEKRPLGWKDGIYPTITINDRLANKNQKFPSNELVTSAYTLITFFPKNLFIQFSKYWNLFFLLVCIITFIPGTSPFNPATSLVPLIFVVGVSMIKDAWEDVKRHKADYESNSRKYKVWENNAFVDTKSKAIRTGDILMITKDSEFPVDLVLLKSSNPDGICHVQTANLDGETSTKILTAYYPTSKLPDDQVTSLQGVINAERPTHLLHVFSGNITLANSNPLPLDHHNLCLRGSRLVLTDYVLGVATFTGSDTKLALNLPSPAHKFSQLDKIMNMTVLGLFIVHELVCIAFAVAATEVYKKTLSKSWYMDTTPTSTVYGVQTFFAFFALLSYVIPISLMIIWEIVKLIQGRFMTLDVSFMVPDLEGGEPRPMVVRNSNLNDELARIQYLFSDKTGTLTANQMEFHEVSVNGKNYPDAARGQLKDVINQGTKESQHIHHFLLHICLNQTSEAQKTKTGGPSFPGPSPDESALLMGAYLNDFKFISRKQEKRTIEILGKEHEFTFLHLLEFTAERRRMSVIIETPDKKVILFTKGADSEIAKRLGKGQDELLAKTNVHVNDYAKEGFRTLFFAFREIDKDELKTFEKEYTEASTSLKDRGLKMEVVMDKIERGLILQGVTGIEDKLQDAVPETIDFFLRANIRVWMITGDKRETAVNIAHKCRLLTHDLKIIQISATSVDDCKTQLENALQEAESGQQIALVIDGESLAWAIPLNQELFAKVGTLSKSVVCCRTAPEQKASVVRAIKKCTKSITASIGDGANDVAMLQEAHIGIGLFGKEGTQAARSADYAIHLFKHVKILVMKHGRFSMWRAAQYVQYFFYKNVVFIMPQFYFAFWSAYSAQTIYDEWVLALFNSVLIVLPPLYIGIWDQDLCEETVLSEPRAFWEAQSGVWFTARTFLWWMLLAIYQGSVVFFVPFAVLYPSQAIWEGGSATDLWSNSQFFAMILLLVVVCQSMLVIQHWNWIGHFAVWFSILFGILVLAVESSAFQYLAPNQFGVFSKVAGSPNYYFTCLLAFAMAIMPPFLINSLRWQLFPAPWQILREKERENGIEEGEGRYCGCYLGDEEEVEFR